MWEPGKARIREDMFKNSREKKVKVIGVSASRCAVHKIKQRDTACEKVLKNSKQITKMTGCEKLRGQ